MAGSPREQSFRRAEPGIKERRGEFRIRAEG